MKSAKRRIGWTILAASVLLATPSLQADLIPVFEYQFPASFDGSSTTVTDLSGAGNHATMDQARGYLDGDVPPGFTGGSITGASGGHGATDAIDLLNNAALEAAGGFTMDVWFQWEGTYTNTRKLIDYAGTEALRTNNSQIQLVMSGSTALAADIVGNQWYHITVEFDTTGNTIAGDGSLSGVARMYLDGVLVDEANVTKTTQGDNLNRPIGINRWAGGAADWNQGKIYNPSVYLGTVPEPATMMLLAAGGVGVLVKRRKQ